MRNVRVTDLKARLSEHLRAVRQGETVTVLDRSQPIARIVPIAADSRPPTVRSPTRTLGSVAIPPPLPGVGILDALAEERGET